MNTCGFCASQINNNYCDFCQMELEDKHITKDGQRFDQSKRFLGYPDRQEIFKSTKELMKLETIHLLCLLREARAYRSDVYKLRYLAHQGKKQAITQGGSPEDLESMNRIDESSYGDYEEATRKVWVIENIIKDRLGYFPKRINEKFLLIYLDRMEKSEQKNMRMEGQRSHATK
jgi:hypothetical protein